MNSPQTIAITGAGRGLGAALAREYAGPRTSLALAARSDDELAQVKRDCQKLGAKVMVQQVDITDQTQLVKWIDNTEQTAPIDLMIVNAGIFSGRGPDENLEPLDSQVRQIEVNLTGAMATAHIAARHMQKRKAGHIALISSLCALAPMADAPAYSASKAGLLAYGEALNEAVLEDNIKISVVLPGHIKTAQTEIHVGPTPGIISAGKAAQIIRQGLDRGDNTIAFPRMSYWYVRLVRWLAWRQRARLNRSSRFHVGNSSDRRGGGSI